MTGTRRRRSVFLAAVDALGAVALCAAVFVLGALTVLVAAIYRYPDRAVGILIVVLGLALLFDGPRP